jgi:soluble lytic murein transglycosylase-like protein
MFEDDLELTLAAYHAGPGIVKRLSRVPAIPETMEYVDYIIAHYSGVAKKKPLYFSLTRDGNAFFTNRPK